MRPSVTTSSRVVTSNVGSAGQTRRPAAVRTTAPKSNRKRILLTGCNSLLGHQLFQQMRNDDVIIKSGG